MTIARVICAPLNYSHRQEGQYAAFREVFGDGLVEFDFMALDRAGVNAGKELVKLAADVKPDWIWLQVQGTEMVTGEHVRKIRDLVPHCVVTHWMGDARTSVPKGLAAMCRATHATLISSTGQRPLYKTAGAKRVEYVQIGLDWDQDVLGLPAWEPPFTVPDVVFCGGYYGGSFPKGSEQRLAAIRSLMKADIPVGVVGTGWPSDIPVVGQCHVKQQIHVYKRAKVALSINHFNDIARYYSDRHLIAMASGTPVVARYVPEMEKEFNVGPSAECLMWNDHEHLIEFTKMLLDNPGWASAMGSRARALVMRDHSWARRIRELLPTIDAIHAELVG